MTNRIPQLSKSRFTAGLQCLKRLYMECFHYDKRDPVSVTTKARFETGHRVGELARKIFPRGVLIAEDHLHHEDAVETTKSELAKGMKTIFEAAFTFDDIKVRVDVLHRNDDATFGLIEVKSAASVKDAHIADVAIQLYVLRGIGLNVTRCEILHINSKYVYQGGEYELNKLFKARDVTQRAEVYLTQIPELLRKMREPLFKDAIPPIAVGPHCNKPHKCNFYDYCHKDLPIDHIMNLPNVSDKLHHELQRLGIERIQDIPDGLKEVKEIHLRVREVLRSGKPFFGEKITLELAKLKPPIFFIDFESFNPALPIYLGTSPYQQIPFQWSVHIIQENDAIEHHEFLADGMDDPRREFAERLITILKKGGPVVVYSSFEKTCLKGIAGVFPELKKQLERIWERFFDLYGLIKSNTYHPDCKGSFSIKDVLPALVPAMSYQGLAISEGGGASLAFMTLLSSQSNQEEKYRIRSDLLAYCQRDTLAMVEVYRYLMKLGKRKVHE